MAELAALNVKLTGDATGLRSALQSAEDGLENVALQARQTTQQTAAVSTGMGRLGAAFGRHSFAISNAANQFSDLAVQMGMGVPASRALSQQLPQMTALMGPLASIIGVASGVLIGLAGNFLMARDNAGGFQGAIDGLTESTRELRDEIFMAQRGLENMAQVAAMREIERLQQSIADNQAELETADTRRARALRGAIELDQARLANLQAQVEENQRLADEAERTSRAIETVMGANLATFEDQVRALANELGIAADEARRLLDNLPVGVTYGSSLGAQGLTGETAIFGGQEGDIPETGGGGGGRSGGGGGRGVSLADQIQADLETLQEGFLSQEELQIASYQRQQDTLQQALNQRLVTQQEHARMMEQVEQSHQFAMVRAANDGARQTLSNLATVFQGSKEISAGIALANSWLAFTEVLKDPSFIGRPFARIAAAGAALSSGLQAVRNIKSASRGGGGASSAGSSVGMAQTASSGATAGGGTSRNVAIQLTGGDMFSRDQVIRLINGINEAVEDGAIVRLA